jgi:hypothetical protein
MRFNKRLVIFLTLSLIGNCVFDLTTIQLTDKYYIPLLQPFGWIFWQGLLLFILPFFVTREQAFDWFQKDYVWGSALLFVLHLVLLVILTQIIISPFEY